MQAPHRAPAAVPGKREIGAVETLGNIACSIHPDKEERDVLLAGLLQRCQPMSSLFETGSELMGDRLNVVAARLDRFGKGLVGRDHPRGETTSKRPVGQTSRALCCETALLN